MEARIIIPSLTAGVVASVLQAVLRSNLAAVPSLPPLYESGVRYGEDHGKGWEEFKGAITTYTDRVGDCADLSCWRAAESECGVAIFQLEGADFWHILVQRKDGRYEDPSALLGMNPAPFEVNEFGIIDKWPSVAPCATVPFAAYRL